MSVRAIASCSKPVGRVLHDVHDTGTDDIGNSVGYKRHFNQGQAYQRVVLPDECPCDITL